ncbi:MAG: rod shape-determining protein MreC [Alphaproteobacteria bacterium]
MADRRTNSQNALGSVASLAALPLRELWRRGSVLFFSAFALALLFLGRAESVIIEQSRTLVTDVATPLLALVSEPIAAMRDGVAATEALFNVYAENRQLKAEVERLKRWEMTARALASERDSLAQLINATAAAPVSELAARMIADTSTPFVRSVVIDAGAADRVTKGQAIIDAAGLVGRVDGVATYASRVLLITDLNSRVPVRLERDRSPAIAAGTNRNALELIHLPVGVSVQRGDRVVTSGDGGLFPAGIPVGRVALVSPEGILITPTADMTRVEWVQVVRHRMPLHVPTDKERALARQEGLLSPTPLPLPTEDALKQGVVAAFINQAVEDGARPKTRPAMPADNNNAAAPAEQAIP